MGHDRRLAPRSPTGPTLLCFDVGLTHAKTVLFAPDGELIDRALVAYPTRRPVTDRAEQDPADWWAALRAGLSELRARTPDAVGAVAGIGVTAHMHALVAVGPSGGTEGPALILGDRRAAAEATTIEAAAGGPARVWHVTGTTMDASMPAAKLRWLRDRAPELFRTAAVFLAAKDFLRHRLTGDSASGPWLTEPVDACATSLYDIRAADWADELLDAVGVGRDRLPRIVAPRAIAGALAAAPAAELALPAGIPVVVGAGDDIEVIGCGLTEPGEALEHLGTTGSIYAVLDAPRDDPTLALELYPHVLPGRWVLGGSLSAAGAAIGWATRLAAYASIEDALDDGVLTGDLDPTGPVFLPGLAGERVPVRDPLARGGWSGLRLDLDRRALVRSVYEGVAFALSRILESIEALAGPQSRLSLSSGGADLHPDWLAVRVAAYGRPLVRRTSPEPTALGLAIIVAAGVGLHPDVATAIRAMTREAGVIEPPAAPPPGLADRRAAFGRTGRALAPIWRTLVGTR